MTLKEEIFSLKNEVIELRRDFHMHPELGFDLPRTSKKVSDYLKSLGLEVQEGIGKSGVVGLLEGKKDGETIMLRADMDALPIEEKNSIPYKSKIKGKMHACGHDGHTAMLLVAAKILSSHKDEINGNVKFVFEPSEEKNPGGAILMIEDGVMENPHVDRAYGLHLGNMYPAGTIGICAGNFSAEPDQFGLRIKGKGGHGGYPHLSIDPIIIASEIVLGLQTIVSREMDPLDPVVITVGKIQSGDVFNVIPEYAEITGTVRTLNRETAMVVAEKIKRVSQNIGAAFRGEVEMIDYIFGYPPVVNDPIETELIKNIAKAVIGEDNIIEITPSMVGEDMSYFLEKAPGAFYWLGSQNVEKGLDRPHHSPDFNFDEDVLTMGVEMHVRTSLCTACGKSPG